MLKIDGSELHSSELVEGWATYFEYLATPCVKVLCPLNRITIESWVFEILESGPPEFSAVKIERLISFYSLNG